MLVWGKACALCVLLMSLSDRIGVVVGFGYLNSYSFAVCAVVAVGFLGAIGFMRSRRARLGFAVFELVLIAIWCGILIVLRWFSADGVQPVPAVLVVYAAVGRIVTLFINMQWNFHFSLNDVGEAARSTIVSVLLALAMFLVSALMDGSLATVLLIVAIVSSGVLNLVLETVENRRQNSPYTIEAVGRADARIPVASHSLPRTRLLYFGARVLYGLALGFLVSVTSLAYPVEAGPVPVVWMMAAALAIGIAGVWLFGSDGKGSLYLVAVLPVLAALATSIGFYSSDIADVARICAMLAEVAWTIQNLFQLPSYRRMTGMKTATFAYYEYAAQIVPFYLSAWIISSNLGALPFASDPNAVGSVGCMCLVVLTACTVAAMTWHILRYHPTRSARSRTRLVAPVGEDRIDGVLTPREREVFSLLAAGYSRPYIAKTLYISVDTVKVHVKHIYAKLGVDSQDGVIELARVAASHARAESE